MTVHVETRGSITIVTIDRPEARNAVDRPTAQLLADAFRAFEADDNANVAIVGRLDAELRIMSITGTSPSYTGVIQTTSDPTFDDNAWQPLSGPASFTGTSAGTFTGTFSGLGRFVRAKLTVSGTSGMVTACWQAVGRDL